MSLPRIPDKRGLVMGLSVTPSLPPEEDEPTLLSIMERFPIFPFTDPQRHRMVSQIIQRHSTNTADIRDIALAGLPWEKTMDVLDLGCGFGFMAQTVARRLPAGSTIVGADACAQNGPPFLSAVRSQGKQAQFFNLMVCEKLPWPQRSFDLVLASYSLYFFPEIIPEIARVLRPEGLLVAITHSERSFAQLCEAVGLTLTDAPIFRLVKKFSAENGMDALSRCFFDVQKIDYPNTLRFLNDQLLPLLEYARFKLPLFREELSQAHFPQSAMVEALTSRIMADGEFSIDKNDAVFHGKGPRCP
jgi:ubiquinone/menaquinone biosynthesis C-methylase UbiE